MICGFGRLGEWFGAIKYDYRPDIITGAKGLTSAYAPMGVTMFGDRIAEALIGNDRMYLHGSTFGGHPIAAAVALKNLEIMEREDVVGNVQRNAPYLEAQLRGLMERHEIIGDVRGAGYFYAIELVPDSKRGTFTPDEADWLLRGYLSPRLFDAGLICRADDRAEPVITLSPPLIAGKEEFEFIESTLRRVLTDASDEWRRTATA